ncbi:MAG TPA: hypothetical protein GX522_02475 [Firmicutes bacterium]|nr:hypothetical protein [Bacillota bacterium]
MDKTVKFAKIVRIITIAPIMALVALSILYVVSPDIFQNFTNYILSVLFLTVMPVLAYPLQPLIPKYRNQGREGQRNLAIVMAVLGYLCSIVSAFCFHMPKKVWQIYLTYFISGTGILSFTNVLKVRASGHACGVVGPISLMVYFIGTKALLGIPVLILVYWACLKLKRHTVYQLFWGSMIPICSLIITVLFTG